MMSTVHFPFNIACSELESKNFKALQEDNHSDRFILENILKSKRNCTASYSPSMEISSSFSSAFAFIVICLTKTSVVHIFLQTFANETKILQYTNRITDT